MIGHQIAYLVLSLALIVLFVMYLSAFKRAVYWRKQWQLACENGEAWEAVATERASIAHDYVNAAKLISIKHNSKECTNYFTFARGDQFYTIETYGQMSDDIPLWRKQLGVEE